MGVYDGGRLGDVDYGGAPMSIGVLRDTICNTEPWIEHAACSGIDNPEIFHPVTGENPVEAKIICWQCPVWRECAAYGLRRNEHGIWGGYTEKERDRIRYGRTVDRRPLCKKRLHLMTTSSVDNDGRRRCRECQRLYRAREGANRRRRLRSVSE
jgi:hypothetical protein